MKIYDREGFPNPIRVRAVVAAKGLESQIEWVSVDLIAAEHKQSPFLARNPAGVVPVLELGMERAVTLAESAPWHFHRMAPASPTRCSCRGRSTIWKRPPIAIAPRCRASIWCSISSPLAATTSPRPYSAR